ncbi:hypothetical protein IH970_13670 [candidate division KSB1 bacterium]|nr:hypothetical protein [candidate division KSB1 bacterium]
MRREDDGTSIITLMAIEGVNVWGRPGLRLSGLWSRGRVRLRRESLS